MIKKLLYSLYINYSFKKIVNKLNDKIFSFFPKKNKILFFDTNGYHRGNYKNITNKLSENILIYR